MPTTKNSEPGESLNPALKRETERRGDEAAGTLRSIAHHPVPAKGESRGDKQGTVGAEPGESLNAGEKLAVSSRLMDLAGHSPRL